MASALQPKRRLASSLRARMVAAREILTRNRLGGPVNGIQSRSSTRAVLTGSGSDTKAKGS